MRRWGRTSKRIGSRITIAAVVVVAIVCAGEFALRFGLGLGSPALIQPDPLVGYYFRPNQQVWRFGRHIRYNAYGQRSDPVDALPHVAGLRVLLVGDSVLNGGALTDQSDTIGELLKGRLRDSGKAVEVIAASAGGWSIDNRLGYLRKFGTFGSNIVIVQVGTEDLSQPMNWYKAGDPDMPAHPPQLALSEAYTRYLPQVVRRLYASAPQPAIDQPLNIEHRPQFEHNLESLRTIVSIIREQHGVPVLLHNPLRRELVTASVAPFATEMLESVHNQGVAIIDLQTEWRDTPKAVIARYFRDEHHFTPEGNQAVADVISKRIPAVSEL